MQTPKAPWIKPGFIDNDTKRLGWMIETLEIDPHDSGHWLYATGLTVYGGHDLTRWDTEGNVMIESLADGIEEFAVLDLASAPGGSELLVAVGDDSGFTFASTADLRTAPKTPWNAPMFPSSTGVDYAGNAADQVIRVGNTPGEPQAAISEDGGATWALHPGAGTAAAGGSVAYSADADTVLWSAAEGAGSGAGVLRSQNGANFSAVSSLPAGAVIASDKRNNTVFYGGASAKFYVSTNAGESFTEAGALGDAGAVRDIAVHPLEAGEVWVSTDVGVFHSTDYGAMFEQPSTAVSNTYQIALGLGSADSWNVYVFGTGPEGPKLYGSADAGASWTDIQGSQGFGAIDSARLAGSGNTAGQVFVGTNGRGVFSASGPIGT